MYAKLKTCAALVLALPFLNISGAAIPQNADWRSYGNTPDFSRFSRLDQIRRDNVQNLQVAWTYHTGGGSDEWKTGIECNPLIVGGVMYVTSPVSEVIALDAATGRELWRFNPLPEQPRYARVWYIAALASIAFLAIAVPVYFIRRGTRIAVLARYYSPALVLVLVGCALVGKNIFLREPRDHHYPLTSVAGIMARIWPNPGDEERHEGPNRGLTYWEEGADKRIFFAGGRRLIALDPRSGRPISSFGKEGIVDLTHGLGRNVDGLLYTVTSPAAIYKDVIIVGSMVGEGPSPAAPGHIRAYDVRSGEERWNFHTIPYPGEKGYDTWPTDAWKSSGGANNWAGMSVDETRGLVFIPTGSATFDFYGADRKGMNLFSNTLLALRADTGQLVWYYQTVHHDLWDYDLPCPPNLVTIQHNGKTIDAVVQPTKAGLVFVLNRETGEPIFPVEERPVPRSTLEGESAWPTQPFPLKPLPLSRLEITESDLTNLSPEAHAFALEKLHKMGGARTFAPPSKSGIIATPGFHGGATWSGASFDARTGHLVLNTNDIPMTLELKRAPFWRSFTFDYTYAPFLDQQGYPAVKPPWGKLTEIDLNSGDVVWQVPLGEYKELTAKGIPVTGTKNGGGSIITAGGLIFIGATNDAKFRAFDVGTGKILWETNLDFSAHAMPATYAVNGKQYVVVAAGGGSMVDSPSGDEYVAFALPDTP